MCLSGRVAWLTYIRPNFNLLWHCNWELRGEGERERKRVREGKINKEISVAYFRPSLFHVTEKKWGKLDRSET